MAHRKVLELEESGITDPRAMAGYTLLLAEALLGVAPFSQNIKAQQKPQPMKHLLHPTKGEPKRKGSLKSEKTVRQLLGELYVDKEYLEKLLLDEGFGRFVGAGPCGKGNLGGGFMHELKAEPVI